MGVNYVLNHVLFGLLKNFEITRDFTQENHGCELHVKSRVISKFFISSNNT